MAKQYARISDYGDLLVPLSLLEKITSQCYIVTTSYSDGKDTITKIKNIDRVSIHTQEDIDAARAQMILEGETS